MKKSYLWLLVLVLSISIIATFSFAGCKVEAVEEAVVEEAAEEVVAEEGENYIFVGNWLMEPALLEAVAGMQQAAEFFNVSLDVVGPTELDSAKMLQDLEIAVSKNPTGIIMFPWEAGEAPLMQQYYDNGGLVACMWNETTSWQYHVRVGLDQVKFGEDIMRWVIESVGKDDFTLGVQTHIGLSAHAQRLEGALKVLEEYPNIKMIDPIDVPFDSAQAVDKLKGFVAANPEVDVFLGLSFLGSGFATALKEAGNTPGEKPVFICEIDDIVKGQILDEYIQGALINSYAVETFYCLSALHILANRPVSVTEAIELDEEFGFIASPFFFSSRTYRITKENAADWSRPKPKDF